MYENHRNHAIELNALRKIYQIDDSKDNRFDLICVDFS